MQVSESTQRRLTYAAGGAAVAVEDAEVTRMEREVPATPVPPGRQQISVDATTVPLVGGPWTDAKVAVIADLVPAVAPDGRPTLDAVNLSYVARWEPAERFARTLTAAAHRRGLERAPELVSPNDGAEWIQGVLDHMAPQAERILDEPHAAEHLGVIGALVYGEQTAAATGWTRRQRTRLRLEDPAGVLAELTRVLAQGPQASAPPGPDGVTPAASLAREVTYVHTRAAQIRYAAFRQARYPMGSDIVESGHKVVISPRFKRAGQHWGAAHLTPLLVLRTTICNDRWEERWPVLWSHQQETIAPARRAAQRRRQVAHQTTADARTLDDVSAPVAAPQTPPAATAPVPGRSAATRRRPAATHPWRRPFLPTRRAS